MPSPRFSRYNRLKLTNMKQVNNTKILGAVIFIVLPFIAFYVGMEYQRNNPNGQITDPPPSIISPSITPQPSIYSPTPVADFPSDDQLKSSPSAWQKQCEIYGGKWIVEFNECEGLRYTQCEELGGIFDDCASACRHNPDPQAVCIQMCIPLCTFN